MKVSLVIPVYNVSDFLDRCLESVQNQTYNDIEVIIVNDGSTDDSESIIDRYVARNKNFIKYSIENRGLGGARNYGTEHSSGEYILYLDSDDYISKDCVEKLVHSAKCYDSDIVVCNNSDVTEEGAVIESYHNKYSSICTNVHDEPEILFNRLSAWGKLIRRSLLDGFEFVSRKWYEDMRLIPKLYMKADKISFVDDILFFYVQRKGSIMNNPCAKRNLEIVEAFDDVIDYMKENDQYHKYKDVIEYMVIEHVAVAAITRVVTMDAADKKSVINDLEKYLSGFEDLHKNPYLDRLGSNKKIVFKLNQKKLYFLTRILMNCKRKTKSLR